MKHNRPPTSSLFFKDNHLKLKGTFFQKALLWSCSIHFALFLLLCSQSLFSLSPEKRQPKPILVQTVQLSPKSERAVARPPEKKKKLPPQKKEPTPAPAEAHDEVSVQQKDPTPIPEEVTVQQKETPSPVEERKAPETKKEVVQKVSLKKEKKQPPATAKKTAKKTPAPQTKPNNNDRQKKKNQELAKNVQSLLAKAKQQRKESAGSKADQKKESSKNLVGQVSNLSFEGDDSQGEEGPSFESTPEETYITNIIRLIQISMTLPDKEPVSLQLELFSSGLLKSLKIVSCRSTRNRLAVEKGLASLRYPAFLRAFKGEKTHCFTFKFTREMEWIRTYP